MRKIMSLCAIMAVFFAMNNIAVRTADAQTETLKSWSRKIDNARERFEVLHQFNDEAVLDRETQLVWERAPKDKPFSSFFETNFFGAIRHCYTVTTGGRMGWRLPTAEEALASQQAERERRRPRLEDVPAPHSIS
jgi:hypothetical protein